MPASASAGLYLGAAVLNFECAACDLAHTYPDPPLIALPNVPSLLQVQFVELGDDGLDFPHDHGIVVGAHERLGMSVNGDHHGYEPDDQHRQDQNLHEDVRIELREQQDHCDQQTQYEH